jgi:hypothetical protein
LRRADLRSPDLFFANESESDAEQTGACAECFDFNGPTCLKVRSSAPSNVVHDVPGWNQSVYQSQLESGQADLVLRTALVMHIEGRMYSFKEAPERSGALLLWATGPVCLIQADTKAFLART